MAGFFKDILSRIYATFIFEDRYKFFLQGLGNTLLLTVASFILGTVFGIILCAMRRSSRKFINQIAKAITMLFVETPTMVLLMILVYIVFGSSIIPVLPVVALGLSLKAGAYLSEIFSTALSTVADGEIEAARTLGMNCWKAFRYVTLPQTVQRALPLYMNEFIVTLQETSVVGYLAIIDLTRASSIVASRTMDSFFGIIAVTIIYFGIGYLAKKIFGIFMKKTEVSA
ncbi:MAG: amino acid ABC transporter permease [Erysipelotrichaceae bacterium]|nr:amino acid ABC transporter permease [Erysipelotrichaceae bacterium]